METLRLATRGSPLALRQTDIVSALLRHAHPDLEVEPVVVKTLGDRESAVSLDRIGGQGAFVTEIEAAVADGRADAAVHSAKDMTSTMPAHLVLGAVPPRADARDGLVGSTLAGLPPGGLVATGSARRRAQLAYLRPDLVFTDLRGNMARRVAVGEDGGVSAVVVAVAAMVRLGWEDRLTDIIDPMDLLPQAGQGTIAVQCRTDDERVRALLDAIDHVPSHRALQAERAVLAALGGSCTVPVAAYAESELELEGKGDGEGDGKGDGLRVTGLVASGDGRTVVRLSRLSRRSRHDDEPERLGSAVAQALLEGGGAAIDGFDVPPTARDAAS